MDNPHPGFKRCIIFVSNIHITHGALVTVYLVILSTPRAVHNLLDLGSSALTYQRSGQAIVLKSYNFAKPISKEQ